MRIFVRQGKGGRDRYTLLSQRNLEILREYSFSKERWIDARKADLLDVGYFHVVFTVPQELNLLIYRSPRECHNLLFRCAAETLQELAKDKKYLGASIGHTAVLHTWGQNLCFHPHIHCIVPTASRRLRTPPVSSNTFDDTLTGLPSPTIVFKARKRLRYVQVAGLQGQQPVERDDAEY